MLARLNALGIDTKLFPTFEQATLLLNFLAPQPQRNNHLPTNELFLENEILKNVAFDHLYGLLLMTIGRRRRELVDDETTRNKVLMHIRLCRKSCFNGTWLDELEEFLKNVEYTEAVAAADRCPYLVAERVFRVKQAQDRLSDAIFAEVVASGTVLFIENERSELNLHGHWEFH